jgi:hypothetical protein
MSAPRRNHGKEQSEWERMCLRKRRHPDEYVARCVALHSLGVNPKPGASVLFVYRCCNCRGWHLTKNASLNMGSIAVTKTELYAEECRP